MFDFWCGYARTLARPWSMRISSTALLDSVPHARRVT
jgi:hypothetical protein